MRDEEKLNNRAAKFHGNGTSGHSKRNFGYNNADSLICQIKETLNCFDVLNMLDIQAHSGKNLICPFHKETNPSFSIYDDGKRFKCFGCEVSGDCIDLFVMLSGMDIAAAIKYLAGIKGKPKKLQVRLSDRKLPTRRASPTLQALNLKADFQSFIADYSGADHPWFLAELQKASSFSTTISEQKNPAAEAVAFLKAVYCHDEYIFMGGRFDAKKSTHVKRRDEWIKAIEYGGVKFPFFCLNPVNPEGAVNANGELSFRTRQNIAKYRFSLFENDTAALRDQLAFWLKMIRKGFPVRAIVFSGNKSFHAITETEPQDIEELKSVFVRLGFDGKTLEPTRMGRFPGHRREDTELFQSLIYLN